MLEQVQSQNGLHHLKISVIGMSLQICLVFLLLKVSFYNVIAKKLIFNYLRMVVYCKFQKEFEKSTSLELCFKDLEQIKNNPGSFSAKK